MSSGNIGAFNLSTNSHRNSNISVQHKGVAIMSQSPSARAGSMNNRDNRNLDNESHLQFVNFASNSGGSGNMNNNYGGERNNSLHRYCNVGGGVNGGERNSRVSIANDIFMDSMLETGQTEGGNGNGNDDVIVKQNCDFTYVENLLATGQTEGGEFNNVKLN